MATVMMARNPKRCSQVYSRFSHMMSSGSGASKMSRAYRFLQASGGRCQQQRILLARGSTSGMGQLLLCRPLETALSAAHAAAVTTSGRSQLLLPVNMPSPPGTWCSREVQHQQPRAACSCAEAWLSRRRPDAGSPCAAAARATSCWRTQMQAQQPRSAQCCPNPDILAS